MLYSNIGVHAIRSVSNGGKNIVLDDNTHWAVSPLDNITTMFWLPADEITVRPYIGSKYKFEHRTLSGKFEVVEATFLGK